MRVSILITVLVMAVSFGAGCAQEDSLEMSAVAHPDSAGSDAVTQDEWPHYGGNLWNERHATFAQITKENVAQLVPRRVMQLGATQFSMSASPLVVDGTLYVSGSNGLVQAFDLRSGARKWSYQHKLDTGGKISPVYGVAGPACCSNTNRGVAFANDTVFFGAIDASVIALDAGTGKKKWQVLGVPKDENPGGIYGYNSAPIAIGDMIVIGSSGGESPTRHHLTAYDQVTGKQVWRWYSIPAPDGSDPLAPDGWWGDFAATTAYGQKLDYRDLETEKANKEKYKDSWKVGGGPMWMPVTYDAELDFIFVGTGNPNPDMDGRGRPGDNLYTNSIVAIDAKTGITRWYFQVAPHDLWDRDSVSPPVVTMLDGRKVIVQAGKIGWMFVLDAETGEFIRKSAPFSEQQNMWVAPSDTPVVVLPGGSGGNEWSPISVDSGRKLAFVGGMNLPVVYTREAELEEDFLGRSKESTTLGGNWTFEVEKANGVFSAIDLTTGDIKWQHKSPYPYVGGVLSISTGVVFQGEPTGNLTAFDADTGDILWQFNTGAGVIAPPIAFTLDGEEFIAVSAGGSALWMTPTGDDVFVFGLPKAWKAAK
jgi:PQQ-dependent dehydrogenase (methanol/ethanol family)